MNLLLNQVLVLRIIGVYHHDRLPPAAALLGIVHLKGSADDEHGQCQPLRVDTSLHQLLRGAHGGAADEGQRDGHTRQPRGEDDAVAILLAPFHEALVRRLVLARNLDGSLRSVLVTVVGVVLPLEVIGVPLGVDNGAKRRRRRDEERTEGDGQRPEGRVAARGEHYTAEAEGQAGRAADQAAFYDDVVVGLFLFFADDLHFGSLCGWLVGVLMD